jgi:hypothetical protein
MAEAMQRNVEPEGSTGRALSGLHSGWPLALTLTAMAVWVEELAAVAATSAAVAPCRLAARAAAAIAV